MLAAAELIDWMSTTSTIHGISIRILGDRLQQKQCCCCCMLLHDDVAPQWRTPWVANLHVSSPLLCFELATVWSCHQPDEVPLLQAGNYVFQIARNFHSGLNKQIYAACKRDGHLAGHQRGGLCAPVAAVNHTGCETLPIVMRSLGLG